MREAPRSLLAGLVTLGVAVTGCGGDDPAASGEVVVFATASLTDAFTDLGKAFEDAHPGMRVTFNFAASSTLVTQIGEGAPADVFASADEANMKRLTDRGDNASEPVVFTTNRLAIIVAPGNPEGIRDVADLANPDLIVIACAPQAPCGRYAQQVLDNAGVTVGFRSLEENVRPVVSKVTLGEADAGIVYVTDVIGAGNAATGVEISPDVNVVAEYPIVATNGAPNPEGAQVFVEFVLSDEGRAILESYGFVSP